MAAKANPDRAVVVHLIRLIQDSADVRYYVGGPHTTMRGLLVEAIKASSFEGDPLDALRPPSHRADDEPRIERIERDRDRLENGLEMIRMALACGDSDKAERLIARLQEGKDA